MILVIYSNFEDLPTLSALPNNHPQADLALAADGCIINNNHDLYTAEAVDFVLNYQPEPFEAAHIDSVVKIGFAP